MGLFSSEHIFTAHAGSSSLLEEDTREDTVKSLMLQTTRLPYSANGSMAEAIVLGLNTNMYARAKSMIKYALREDGYVYGLPETSHQSVYIQGANIQAAIERDVGAEVALETADWGAISAVFFDDYLAAGGTGTLADYPTPPDYIYVRYHTVMVPGTTEYWIYTIGSGDDPILEDQIESDSLDWKYLPIAVLMHDRVWFDEQNDPELEKTTDRLVKDLTLDAYEIKEEYIAAVEEGIESGERPGPAVLDDWDVFVHFAVPFKSQIRGSQEFLFYYLKFLNERASWTTREDYEAFLASGGAQPSSNFHLSEGEGSNPDWTKVGTSYQAYYAWSYIDEVTHEGDYTPPGWTEPLRIPKMHSKVYQWGKPGYADGIEEVHGAGAAIAPYNASAPLGEYHDYAVFTKPEQDVDGNRSYTQVIMMAPSMMWLINTQEGPQYVDAPLFPTDPGEESEFRMSIHIGALEETATMHREEVLQDALCATAFLIDHQKVKWYQQTFWKWLIIIIVIIIMILAWRYEWLPTILAMAGAATGGTALALYLLYVVVVFALGFLISFTGALIGGTWGTVFVIVASLMMAGGNPFAGLNWGSTATTGWGSAAAFVQAVEPILAISTTIVHDVQENKYENDLRDLELTAREKYEELENAWNMLGPSPTWLDPMDLIRQTEMTYIEYSDNFFERTLNENPGRLGYDLIDEFAEIVLQLPQDGNATDILGQMFNDFKKQQGAA